MITSPKEPKIFEQDVHYYSTNHQEVPALNSIPAPHYLGYHN